MPAYVNPYAGQNPYADWLDPAFADRNTNIFKSGAWDQLNGGEGGDPQQGFGVFRSLWNQFYNGNKDTFDRWLSGQYSKYFNDYMGKQVSDPNLQWLDYLKTVNPVEQFTLQSPSARGENPTAYYSRARWLR